MHMVIFPIWVITDCLAKEQQHSTTIHPLLKMVQTYKGSDDLEVEKLWQKQAFYNLVGKIWKKKVPSNLMAE